MASYKKPILFVATSLLAAFTVLWMQGKFEAGDHRHAVSLVQTYRSKTGVSILDVLSNRHPGKAIIWSSRTDSACFQHVRVQGSVQESTAAASVLYVFVVDINGPAIHPGNELGKGVLRALDEPLLPAVSGSAVAAASVPPAASTPPAASVSASVKPAEVNPVAGNEK